MNVNESSFSMRTEDEVEVVTENIEDNENATEKTSQKDMNEEIVVDSDMIETVWLE